jgi:RNA polymerase sigma-70 factor (ECF subfamily)
MVDAWPEIELPRDVFAAYLAERVQSPAELDRDRWSELFLACACAHGDARALASFEQSYLQPARPVVARRIPDRDVDDVMQMLREKLLVGSSRRPPAILKYTGRGSLKGWVRMVAARVALRVLRDDVAPPVDVALDGLLAADADPELSCLLAHYNRQFRDAFSASLAAIQGRERAVFLLHWSEGLSPGQIAELFRVHRTTVMRWLVSTHRTLLRETQRRLTRTLGVDQAQLDSILRLIESRLTLSLGGLV